MHRSCRVSVTGLDGITYSAVVTAESVYEAITLGLLEIKRSTHPVERAKRKRVRQILGMEKSGKR